MKITAQATPLLSERSESRIAYCNFNFHNESLQSSELAGILSASNLHVWDWSQSICVSRFFFKLDKEICFKKLEKSNGNAKSINFIYGG